MARNRNETIILSTLILTAILFTSLTSGAPLDTLPALDTELSPPRVDAQSYWGNPSNGPSAELELPEPRPPRSDLANDIQDRVILIFTLDGPVMRSSDESAEPELYTSTTEGASTTGSAEEMEKAVVRGKRNKRPIRYRNKSKNSRGRPTF